MTSAGEASFYPVFLDVRDRRCVVLGGGTVAVDKVRGLLGAGAAVTVVDPAPHADLDALGRAGVITLARRSFADGDLAGARLAIDATGDERVNQRSRVEAERCGAILNVVDRPALCDFIAPAVVRRGRLHLAVSTSGVSPFLASTMRARLERDIGEDWTQLTEMLGTLRQRLRARGMGPEEQVRAYRRLLDPDVRRLLREGRSAEAEAMAAAVTGRRCGRVSIIGAGPGDPGLLTLAGRDLLACADVVFHDALVSAGVLAFAAPHARLVNVGKRGGRPSTPQGDITSALIEAARRGDHAVRLKGGDPHVFGRAAEEAHELATAGIEVRVIPGISAAIAAPALAGIPLTRRGVSSSFVVVSGQLARGENDDDRLERAANGADTLVVLMPMAHLDSICERLGAVVGPERPAALVADASLSAQAEVRSTLAALPATARRCGLGAPATLVVGDVVGRGPAADPVLGSTGHC